MANEVQARFWIQWIKKSASSDGFTYEVFMQPVVSPSQGNSNWSKYTPSGDIRLVVTNEAAGEWFNDRLKKNLAVSFGDVPPEG